jgi:hypothetical protein
MTIFKTGDILKVHFYDHFYESEKTLYGMIVNDIEDSTGRVKGIYLHDGSTFLITNDGNTKDQYGRIILEKVS